MQKPLEWRNMGYFQDMGLLFIYSLIVLLWKEPDRTLNFCDSLGGNPDLRNLFHTWKKHKSFGLYSICFNGTCSA